MAKDLFELAKRGAVENLNRLHRLQPFLLIQTGEHDVAGFALGDIPRDFLSAALRVLGQTFRPEQQPMAAVFILDIYFLPMPADPSWEALSRDELLTTVGAVHAPLADNPGAKDAVLVFEHKLDGSKRASILTYEREVTLEATTILWGEEQTYAGDILDTSLSIFMDTIRANS